MVSLLVLTPIAFISPFISCVKISITLSLYFISISSSFIFLVKHFKTSTDLSVHGNILFPLSSFTSNPCFCKNSIISLLVYCWYALYKNIPFPGVFFIKSLISNDDVILHLPFPVINSFLPNWLFFSIKHTSFPFSFAVIADIIPAGPPPITMTFFNYILLWNFFTIILLFIHFFYCF